MAAWSTGLAGLYVLLSFLHAAVVERALTVDVAFGRSLAFWVGAIYVGLLLWGFLPARPTGRYAGRRLLVALGAVGAMSLLACVGVAGAWLAGHWVPSIGGPVAASIAGLVGTAAVVLWLAGREERPEPTA